MRNDENKGTAYTTNRLINAASGEYLGMLASDDWIEEKKIELQLEYMMQKGLDAVFSPIIKYETKSDTYTVIKDEELAKLDSTEKILGRFYETGQGAGLLQSALFRTECAKKIGMLDEYKCEDAIFQMRFLQAGYKVGYLNEPLTYYRIHGNNLHQNALYILNEFEIPFIRDFFPKENYKKIVAISYENAAHKLALQMNIKSSFALQIKALKNHISWKMIKGFLRADIRYCMMKTGCYRYYWKIVHHEEWGKEE